MKVGLGRMKLTRVNCTGPGFVMAKRWSVYVNTRRMCPWLVRRFSAASKKWHSDEKRRRERENVGG